MTQNINKIQRSTIGFSLSGKETRDIGIGLAEIFIIDIILNMITHEEEA